MTIYPLFSSSKGNLFLLENGSSNILIDVGVNYKNICLALKGVNKCLSDISAILITHEHNDHIKGLPLVCKNHNIPIYTSSKTKDYLEDLLSLKNIKNEIHGFEYDKTFKINELNITLFETSHDAVMPSGYYISNKINSLAFATDLGYVSDNILKYFEKADYVILESNYDKVMLDYGNYPFYLKKRINSNVGHLSNTIAASTINSLIKNNCNKKFLMSHLSENNNTEYIAKDTIFNHLNENGINEYNICFASPQMSFEGYSV